MLKPARRVRGVARRNSCSSEPGTRTNCPANTSAGVVLTGSIGSAPCLLGKTWGYDDQSVWVSDGCSAEFLAGQYVAANPGLNKLVIVVDDDVDILDPADVLDAISSRWQPGASLLVPRTQMTMPDPSRVTRGLSGKMVIDATRQLPGEGGPTSWAPTGGVTSRLPAGRHAPWREARRPGTLLLACAPARQPRSRAPLLPRARPARLEP